MFPWYVLCFCNWRTLFGVNTSCFTEQVHHVIKYTHNIFPYPTLILYCYNETRINYPINVLTMPPEHCYHLPQSAQRQLVCVCVSCTIPRYVLPFQEVIDWGKAALVMDERAVFQVRRLVQCQLLYEVWCALLVDCKHFQIRACLNYVHHTWHLCSWLRTQATIYVVCMYVQACIHSSTGSHRHSLVH